MTGLVLKDIRKAYGQVKVLHGIDLEIKEGEFVVFVGPSGCGKSTLMNCIAGLETITGGAIMIGDQDVSGMSPKDRDIAMVFQSYALYPTMSVRENIEFGLKIRKMPAAEIDAEDLGRDVGEGDVGHRGSLIGRGRPGLLAGQVIVITGASGTDASTLKR